MAGLIIDSGSLVVSGSMLMTGSAAIVGSLTVNGTSIPSGGGGITSFQLEPRTTSYTQATAPGCDYVFQTASIAGGTFVPGDILEFRFMIEQTAGSGTTYVTTNMTLGDHSPGDPYPGIAASYQLGGSQSSGNGKAFLSKTLYINSATETAVWTPGNSCDTFNNGISGGDPVEVYNIDWTSTQTWWYGACIDNAGHTLKNYGGIIRKLNA
jgi:hypothetical protein